MGGREKNIGGERETRTRQQGKRQTKTTENSPLGKKEGGKKFVGIKKRKGGK